MSVMNTVTHSSAEMSISLSRLVRKYKLDICISDISLEEDNSSSETSIASLQNPVEARSMLVESVTDPEPIKDEGLEYYGPNVITALFPLGDLACIVCDEYLDLMQLYLKSWGKSLQVSEIWGFDIGIANRSITTSNPDYNWYASLVYVGLTEPTSSLSAKRSLLEACDVTKPFRKASSNRGFMIDYNHDPNDEADAQFKQQLVAWLGWDPEISPLRTGPIEVIKPRRN